LGPQSNFTKKYCECGVIGSRRGLLIFMIYDNCKIYGPYIGKKDGRLRIVIHFPSGKKATMSYPKFLMEQHLNRHLTDDETVDHIDCNVQNNELSNLRILNRDEHARIDAIRLNKQDFRCPMCNRDFSLDGKRLHDTILNRKKNKAGPFCSRKCAGKYGKNIQNGSEKLEVITIIPSYTTWKNNKSLHEETHEVDIAKTVNASR
jgi:hypothetical protein